MKGTRLAAVALFLFVLAIYLLTFGGIFHSIDEELYLRITGALVEGGTFAVTPIEYAPTFSVAPGLDGQLYANRGPGFPIFAVPFYLLGKALASSVAPYTMPMQGGIGDPTLFVLSLSLANTMVVAATVALLFVTLVALGYGRASSAAVALLFAFGTLAWPYASKSFFAEPSLALTSLATFYFALRHRQSDSRLMLVLAGASVGWGVLIKVTAFALIPVLAAYAVWPEKGRPLRWRTAFGRLAWLAISMAPFVVAWMASNYLRFGNVFVTGYDLDDGSKALLVDEPGLFLLGLYGLILSPGKGLLVYAAPVLLGLWAAPKFWRAHPGEAVFVFGAALATVLGVAMWRDWSGGWCWGPRLILNVVPLLMIPTAQLLSARPRHDRRGCWAIGGLTLFSVAVQFLGVLPNYLDWYLTVGNYNLVYFSPMYSPIVGHWQAMMGGGIDLFWDKVDVFFPGQAPLFVTLRWALAGVAVVAGFALWQAIGRGALCLVFHVSRLSPGLSRQDKA